MNHEEQRDVGPATLTLGGMPDDSINYLEGDDEFEGPLGSGNTCTGTIQWAVDG